MSDVTDILKDFFNKLVPVKYQSIITLILIVGFLSSTITTCIRNSETSNKDIKEELQKINKNLENYDKRLKKVEAKLITIDSTTTQTKVSIVFVKATQDQQFGDICDIIERGFSVTSQELSRLHHEDKEFIQLRFEDLSKYISNVIRRDSVRYHTNVTKIK